MGIFGRKSFLRSSGDVTVLNPFVSPTKPDAEYKTAELTIRGEVAQPFEMKAVKACLLAESKTIELQQTVELNGGDRDREICAGINSQN